MFIKAVVKGHPFDLETLAELFPLPADPAVVADADKHYLISEFVTHDILTDGAAAYEDARELLRTVLGAARVLGIEVESVRLAGQFQDRGTRRLVSVAPAGIRLRAPTSPSLVRDDDGRPISPPLAGPG